MPPAKPVRDQSADYHFHTYVSTPGPFQPTANAVGNQMLRFFSLEQDLVGLLQIGQDSHVPNIRLRNLGSPTGEGRVMKVLSFGNARNATDAPTVLFTGGIHAREWIAPEIAYLIAEYLVINYTTTPANHYEDALRRLIDARNIYVIPMLNPDGNHYSVFDTTNNARLWRKNRKPLPVTAAEWVNLLAPRGNPNDPFRDVSAPPGDLAKYSFPVYDPDDSLPPGDTYQSQSLAVGRFGIDLNRNYDTPAWGYAAMIKNPVTKTVQYRGADPVADAYFGPNRVSEPETGNVQAFLAGSGRAPATMIDYHSYYQVILYPSEVFNNGAVRPDYEALGDLLEQLIGGSYGLGSPLQQIGYDATGTIIDYAAQVYQTRAFTIELDPTKTETDSSGNTIGFELPESRIQDVFEKNIRSTLAAIAAPGRPSWFNSLFRRSTVGQFDLDLTTWNVSGRGNQLPSP
jgi:hypothetical protein